MILKQNVGIDCSKESFDVALVTMNNFVEVNVISSKKFPNTDDGFHKLLDWLSKHKADKLPVHFTMEFTGVYYESLAYFLIENRFPVYMVLANKAKKYMESLDIKSKTDKLDARSLAYLGVERKLREWTPGCPFYRELKTLTRERAELLKEKTVVNNRAHAEKSKAKSKETTLNRYKQRIELVNSQVEEIEKEIKTLIATDQRTLAKIKNVMTIPGVGLTTAVTIIAETAGFEAFSNLKQLYSYAGYDVRLKESGAYRGQSRISKKGNSHIRRAMHFPAQVAITYNKPMTNFFERVNRRKIKPMIASTAVQRKLLGLIYTLWKNESVFDQNHFKYNLNKVGAE